MIKFKIINDKEKAKKLWEKFSPHIVIDDEWDFRDIWTKEFDFPFHFIAGYDGDKTVGLLPLQLNTMRGLAAKHLALKKPFLEFFGGIDIDDSRPLLLPGYEQYTEELLKQITQPAALTYLNKPYQVNGNTAEFYLNRFYLDLTQFSDFTDFLQKNLDGRSRQRMINRNNKIEKRFTVEVTKGNEKDLELLFALSIEKFGESSSFNMPQRQQVYRDFLKRFDTDLFVIRLDREVKAVSMAIVHNKMYTTLSIGYDYNVRDLSKYLIMNQLKRAIDLQCKIFDAGKGDNGWKEHFHFTNVPQYKLILNYTLSKANE